MNSETVGGLPVWRDMRAYTSEELIRTPSKSVSVSLGEIKSENKKKVRVSFSVARVLQGSQVGQLAENPAHLMLIPFWLASL